MASQFLLRDGMQIPLEKTSDFITVSFKKHQSFLKGLDDMRGVKKWKHVFDLTYKIETSEEEREGLMSELRDAVEVVHHAYSPEGDPATRYYITDKIVVTFTPETTVADQEVILHKHRLKWVKNYDKMHSYLVQVTTETGKNPIKVANDLIENPQVESAEPNIINRFLPFYTPVDRYFKNQWHLDSKRGINLDANAGIEATSAWDISRGLRRVIVGVVDDGFDLTHPDLQGFGKVVFPRDFVDGDEEPMASADRGDFHGTPCAGLAIGEENGEGILGVAPNCAFMPIRINFALDDNTLFDIFDYAANRANVLSCSWGPLPVYAPLSSLLRKQIKQLVETGGPDGKGCVILFAAGNNNAPVKDLSNKSFKWRHPVMGFKETTGPILNGYAAHDEVMAISASTSTNKKALYSNWGKEISVCAPSNNVHPLDPGTLLPGRGVWTSDNKNFGVGYNYGNHYTGDFGGTSCSTPIVAGLAALVKSVAPDLTARQIRSIIEETADKITDQEPDPILGNLKGNYDERGFSEWFGFGKVNAHKALLRALELGGKPTIDDTDGDLAYTGVKIIAAYVNPPGFDRGKEKITIINTTDRTIQFNNGKVIDNKGRMDTIEEFFIMSGQVFNIILRKTKLSNKGGNIRLLDGEGRLVSVFSYDKEEVDENGWVIKVG